MKREFETFEEYFDASDVVWDDEDPSGTPEDMAAYQYAQIDYEEVRDGKLVDVNVLDDLLEPFRTGLLDALDIKDPTVTQEQAIYRALSRAFGSGCITEKRQDYRNRGLNASNKSRSRDAIDKYDLLFSDWKKLGQPTYKKLREHMIEKHGITYKVDTIGVYIRRMLKQQDKK